MALEPGLWIRQLFPRQKELIEGVLCMSKSFAYNVQFKLLFPPQPVKLEFDLLLQLLSQLHVLANPSTLQTMSK